MADVEMKRVKELIAKKDAIENEIKELKEVLESVRTCSYQKDELFYLVTILLLIFFCSKKVLEWMVNWLTAKISHEMTSMFTLLGLQETK
jgi:IS4 transposase